MSSNEGSKVGRALRSVATWVSDKTKTFLKPTVKSKKVLPIHNTFIEPKNKNPSSSVVTENLQLPASVKIVDIDREEPFVLPEGNYSTLEYGPYQRKYAEIPFVMVVVIAEFAKRSSKEVLVDVAQAVDKIGVLKESDCREDLIATAEYLYELVKKKAR